MVLMTAHEDDNRHTCDVTSK